MLSMTAAMKSSELRARYERDGLVFPVSIMTSEQASQFRQACDQLETRMGGRPRTIEVRQMHLHYRWAAELATWPRILDVVESLLGPDVLVWATELFAKHPQDPSVSIGWHRDKDYMGFDSSRTVTAWVALSPCTEANGCLMAIPGTSRLRRSEIEVRGGTKALDGAELRRQATCVLLEPGQMSLHDSDILHGSGPNLSEEKRVGFAIRYIAASVRPRHGRPEVLLARGEDTFGHFQLVKPQFEAEEEVALAELKRSAVRHFDAVLANLADRGGTHANKTEQRT